MPPSDFEDIVETFSFLDSWEERYRYIIELGKAMPELEPSLKTPIHKVDGCASQVWIVPQINSEDSQASFSFQGDSDAIIVRGLIAILQKLVSGSRMDDLVKLDIVKELSRLELDSHLSAQRSNGLKFMIARIKSWAKASANINHTL